MPSGLQLPRRELAAVLVFLTAGVSWPSAAGFTCTNATGLTEIGPMRCLPDVTGKAFRLDGLGFGDYILLSEYEGAFSSKGRPQRNVPGILLPGTRRAGPCRRNASPKTTPPGSFHPAGWT